jgi:hypothetical protein
MSHLHTHTHRHTHTHTHTHIHSKQATWTKCLNEVVNNLWHYPQIIHESHSQGQHVHHLLAIVARLARYKVINGNPLIGTTIPWDAWFDVQKVIVL